MKAILFGWLLVFVVMASCTNKNRDTLFELLDAESTNIQFANTITTTDNINVIDFQYCYNGGGVGVGDFDQNGLPDLLFTGNQVSSKLYLNQGDFKFRDVTSIAVLQTKTWVTGVSIVDINADGWDDIYLNVGGADCNGDCPNLLFVNQGLNKDGIPTFQEAAAEYGLQELGYAQQTAFFDYDLDGDLDAYILRNGNFAFDKNSPVPKRYFPEHLSDVLLRNNAADQDTTMYTDVSEEMGIIHKGFGLGLGINDMNNDGWPDLYVGNDFITNDLVYINQPSAQGSLGFTEMADYYLGHQTYNSMGVDVVDLNNDTAPDVMVLDMLPNSYRRQKTMMGLMNYDKYELALRNDYTPQFMRNTMHLSNGFLNGSPLKYSEVSFVAETAQTDWSWSPLLADYDCDGDKDLFVTNGYGKDITDLDFINYTSQNNIFGTEESRNKKLKQLVGDLPSVQLQNFFFENTSGLGFENATKDWVPERPSLSNGAAYADLDLDGDLDLIVNNMDQEAFVLKNLRSEKEGYHYLNIKLKGSKTNKEAIGAKVELWSDGAVQTHFQSVIRGYLSSVEPGAFFGLKSDQVDSVRVTWPRGRVTVVRSPKTNQTLVLQLQDASIQKKIKKPNRLLFKENDSLLRFKHNENPSNDYIHQNLLMTQHSKLGPAMATANLKSSGPVLFTGGSHGKPGLLWKQNNRSGFEVYQKLDSLYEDSAAIFLDIDNDGDQDLYVGSGSNEQLPGSALYQDRIYVNDGAGHFTRDKNRLPEFFQSTSCVRPMDIDQDGDLDLFVGSNIVPKNYPTAPKNYVLLNEEGRFTIRKEPSFESLGMVKDAVWNDLDADGWADLMVVGDWMPITVYKNQQGTLQEWEISIINNEGVEMDTSGWWKCIEMADFDKDGDSDFLLGNQGLNNFISPTQQHPQYIYEEDFDGNGSIDPLIGAYYNTEEGQELKPLHARDDVMKQLVQLKNAYRSYEAFATVDFKTLLQIQDLSEKTLKASMSESIYLEHVGDFEFKVRPLPAACQVAPINDFLVNDFDKDGHIDVLAVGNDYQSETHYGRYDAFNGQFLKGLGKGEFSAVPPSKSGFYVPQQSNSVLELKMDKAPSIFIAAQNNDSIKVFQSNLNHSNE